MGVTDSARMLRGHWVEAENQFRVIVGESVGLRAHAAIALCMDIAADTFGGFDQFGGCGQRFAKHAIGTLDEVVVYDRVPQQSQLPPALSG